VYSCEKKMTENWHLSPNISESTKPIFTRVDRHVWIVNLTFVFAVAQGMLLWQLINFWGKNRHRLIPPSLFALVLYNELEYRSLNARTSSGYHEATSCKNCILSVNREFAAEVYSMCR